MTSTSTRPQQAQALSYLSSLLHPTPTPHAPLPLPPAAQTYIFPSTILSVSTLPSSPTEILLLTTDTHNQKAMITISLSDLEEDAEDVREEVLGMCQEGKTVVLWRPTKWQCERNRLLEFTVTGQQWEDGEVTILGEPVSRVLEVVKSADMAMEGVVEEGGICGECGMEGNKLSRCGGCQVVRYCSRECQKKGWQNGHKGQCFFLQSITTLTEEQADALRSLIQGS
ncbi:hypothetical protein BJ508DRAFT_413198 [Ascobolus immersus RN42]|uniref:MYND-type domain-containing protein n=1 Tax=Ascobolus immersus RN42 TaxID=1160509 RepID=A0A3N4IE67_ASCIM|nr:hypothetical protein BJ508DRAFT_413198 [Ascobolus immersus RN42]